MNLEPVKIGVIGCGGYAFQLIIRIMSVPSDGIITAVTSRDVTSAGARYCRDRGIQVFQTVDELLVYGGFDVVINPTPIHLHSLVTKKCLDAGYPVWMEKPPVATVQELDDLQAAAKAADLPVAVCFNSLFSHLVQNLKKELLEGRFGKIQRVKGIGAWIRTSAYFNRNSWAGKIQSNGQWVLDGDLNNPFAHVLCNSLFFAAPKQRGLADPVTVEAELYRCNDIESEDTSCLRIVTREGIEVMQWLTLSPKSEIPPRTVIETEKALITFEDFKQLKIEFRDGSIEEHTAYQEDRIEMVQHLCRAFRTGEFYLSGLDIIRPYTVAVNCAFESTGSISSIQEEFLIRKTDKDAEQVAVRDIEATMEKAFTANSLYAELGVPWARKAEKYSVENYSHFPVRFNTPSDS